MNEIPNRVNGGREPLQPQGQPMHINPVEAARAGVAFLQRVQFTASERQAFDAIEALLQAIGSGQAIVTARPSEAEPAPVDQPVN